MKIFRKNFLREKEIGIISSGGYRYENNHSRKALQWLIWMERELGYPIHARRGLLRVVTCIILKLIIFSLRFHSIINALYKPTTLIKKFPEFTHKIKNTSLFFKIDVVPFEVIPIDCNALMPALDPVLKTFVVLDFRYVHQSRLRLLYYLLSAAKTRSP